MRLSTTSVGDGPRRAALVHGLSGHGGTWFELAPWIADHGYTVTLVDQRGHGRSARAATYSTTDLADDLVDTLPRELDLIVGHSLGGRALLAAAARLTPKRAVYLDPGWIVPPGLEFRRPEHDDGSPFDLDELAAMLPGYSPEHLENSRLSFELWDPAWIAPPHPELPPMHPPMPPDVPSLVVLADPSVAVPAELQVRLRAGGYTVEVVPDGAHDLHILNLDETKAAIEGWLQTGAHDRDG